MPSISSSVDLSAFHARIDDAVAKLEAGTRTPELRDAFTQASALYLGLIRRRYIGAARGDGTWKPLADSTIIGRRFKGDQRGTLSNLRAQLSAAKVGSFTPIMRKIRKAEDTQRVSQLKRKIALATSRRNEAEALRQSAKLSAELKRQKGAKAAQAFDKAISKLPNVNVEILRDTNTLFASLTTGAPGNVDRLIPDGVEVGTAITYAKYHQEGSGRLPRREILVPPDDATAARISRILNAAVSKILAGGQ